MTTAELEPVDYLTLLGYVKALGIKIYKPSQINSKYTESELLGSGNSMNVYRGELIEDPSATNYERIPIAIKVPKANIKDMNRDSKVFKILADVRQELRMMKHFDTHPNIINLYGVIFQDLKPFTIVELAEDCITDYLALKKEEDFPVDWETKARFCCEVADGLRALHAAKIVHGDLKGDNILLFEDYDKKLIAKIADFGYSATTASIERGGKTGGSLNFLAPECTKYAPENMREYEDQPLKDRYAFGLFVWQVAKDGETPYNGMNEDSIHNLKNYDTNLDRLMNDMEEDTPLYFKDVIMAMTKYVPEEREALTKVREIMGLDVMSDASYIAAKNDLELYAKELPRDIAKADLSSIELMSIPLSLKTRIYRNYEKLATSGDANAMFMMAICHSTGFALERDRVKALDWCIKAAEAGSLNAILNIAENYEMRSLSIDPEVAFPWYLKAAEEGYSNAAFQTYICYIRGYGVGKDEQKANYWLAMSQRYVTTHTPMMEMNIGEISLHRAARLGDLEAATSLLEQRNVDVTAKNNDGQTALHIAAEHGHYEIVKLLLTMLEADMNAKDKYNRTPLKLAAGRGYVKIVRLFVDETTITTLDLADNKLGVSEARFLVESLKMYTALARLDLRLNDIHDEGACALAEHLRDNTTITELHLGWNNIGDEGARAIGQCLKHNSTLTQLYLYGGAGDDEEPDDLVEDLELDSSFARLDLDKDNIGDEGAFALAECLKENSTLTHLYLGWNKIGDKGACALAEGLKQNFTLVELDLYANEIGDEGINALTECLKNSTLTRLNLEDNQ